MKGLISRLAHSWLFSPRGKLLQFSCRNIPPAGCRGMTQAQRARHLILIFRACCLSFTSRVLSASAACRCMRSWKTLSVTRATRYCWYCRCRCDGVPKPTPWMQKVSDGKVCLLGFNLFTQLKAKWKSHKVTCRTHFYIVVNTILLSQFKTCKSFNLTAVPHWNQLTISLFKSVVSYSVSQTTMENPHSQPQES